MAQTERDELADIARSLAAHLEWQREMGVAGLERSTSTPHALAHSESAAATTAPRIERPTVTRAAPSAPHGSQDSARDDRVATEPEPTPGGAPKFEMPSFLKKKGPAPTPARTESAASPKPRTPTIEPASEAVEKPRVEPVRVAEKPRVEPAPVVAEKKSAEPARDAWTPSNVAIASRPVVTGDERIQRLSVVQNVVSGCTKCRLHEGRTQTVFSRGNPNAPLAFVGEGPGRDEDLQGKPFVGAAGQLLDKIIAAMGLTENDVYICNVVKCRPPNNRVPAPDEMAACTPYLVEQLGLVRPQYIVALGKTAASFLLESTETMAQLRGTWRTWQGIPLLATWHPAYLLRMPAAKKDTWDDMKLVLQRMGRPIPKSGGGGGAGSAQ